MTPITHLDQTVTPTVLANSPITDETDQLNAQLMLEQWYALVAVRLSDNQLYQHCQTILTARQSDNAMRLFEQIWPDISQRQQIIASLVETYYIPASDTEQCILQSLPLILTELEGISQRIGLTVPNYLTQNLASIRAQLPSWAAPFMVANAVGGISSVTSTSNSETTLSNNEIEVNNAPDSLASSRLGDLSALTQSIDEEQVSAPLDINLDINPSENASQPATELAAKYKGSRYRPDSRLIWWIVAGILVIGGLIALAVTLYFKAEQAANNAQTPAPAPVIAPAPASVVAKQPVILSIKMDVAQTLYSCEATVGDVALQQQLTAALHTILGEQVSNCKFTVDTNVANTMPTLANLPAIIATLQPVPFATLRLEGNNLSLTAPDQLMLEQMATNIQAIAPNISITALPPLAGTVPANPPEPMGYENGMAPNNPEGYITNGTDGQGVQNGLPPQGYESGMGSPANSMPNTSMPSNNNDATMNPSANGYPANGYPESAPPAANSGPISQSELESMINTTIVSEPPSGGRPVTSANSP